MTIYRYLRNNARRYLESAMNIRLLRRPLPRGIDFLIDMDQVFGNSNFSLIFDIGANVGQTARVYHAEFSQARICSFEPVSSTFQELCTNVSKECLTRVEPLQLAMGAMCEKLELKLHTDSRVNSIVGPPAYESTVELINVTTLDAFAQERKFEFIDLIKSDMEGFELNVIRGADSILREQRAAILIFECEPYATEQAWVSFSDLAQVLRDYNYFPFGIYEQTPRWQSIHDLSYFNVAFVSDTFRKPSICPQTYAAARMRK